MKKDNGIETGSEVEESTLASGKKSRRDVLKGAAVGGAGAVAMGATMLADMNQGRAAEGEPIPIGHALAFTGWAAHDAAEFKNGIELARDEINAMGGVLGRPLESYYEDSKNMSADEMVGAYNRLIDRHGVHVIINGYNIGSNNAEYEVVADTGILQLHDNTIISHDAIYKSDPERHFGSFMTDPPEYNYGPGYIHFISWLRDTGQWKPRNNKIALVSGSSEYSITIANALEKTAPEFDWEIAFGPEIVATPMSDWGPVLAKVREVDPAAFVNTHWASQEIAQCQNQFMQDPIDCLTYYQFGAISAVFTDIAQDNAIGVTVATDIGLLQDDMGNEFKDKYIARFGANSTPLVGCQTYVNMYHWSMAAAMAGGSGEPGNFDQNRLVADRLNNLIYRSVLGTVKFNPETRSAVPYPSETNDPSLGMPTLYFQIQENSSERALISPPPYNVSNFMIPPWFKDNGGLPQLKT